MPREPLVPKQFPERKGLHHQLPLLAIVNNKASIQKTNWRYKVPKEVSLTTKMIQI